jgi:hypothetical protein
MIDRKCGDGKLLHQLLTSLLGESCAVWIVEVAGD